MKDKKDGIVPLDSFSGKEIIDTVIDSITEMFGNIPINFFVDNNNDSWFLPIDLAKALDYAKPPQSADDILKRNAEHFVGETKEFPMPHSAATESRLSETAARFFVMCSQQPKAKELKMFLAKKCTENRKRNLLPMDPLQRSLVISRQITEAIETQIEQRNQIAEVKDDVELLKERTAVLSEELYNLNKSQRYNISNKVKEMVINAKHLFPDRSEKQLYGSFYGILKDHFEVTSYQDIPRERFEEAIKLLDGVDKLVQCGQVNLNGYLTPKEVMALCRQHGHL